MSAVTIYGVCAVSFMMVMYALEPRGRGFVLAFAAGCLLSSAYGFLSGAWPFGVVEAVWAVVAVRRYFIAPAHGSSPRPVAAEAPPMNRFDASVIAAVAPGRASS
jgi:hypothetical protein